MNRCMAKDVILLGEGRRVLGEESMGFVEAIRTCFSKYATFSGRARRPEFWFFWLFTFIASAVGELIDKAVGSPIVGPIISLVLVLPNLAVLARRLHDIDRTSWWLLLYFVPVIGWIALIGFACLPGTLGPNRYGPDPFADVVRATSV